MDGRNSSVRRTSGRGSSLYSTPGGYGVPPANTPEFTKTLRLSHTSPHYSAKLVSHPLSKSFPKLLVCTEYPCHGCTVRFESVRNPCPCLCNSPEFSLWTTLNECQDIPVSFWRKYGKDKFNMQSYTLWGPYSTVTVTVIVNRTPKQTFCYFTHGWALFRDENFFKVGYTLVSPVHFQVIQT